MKSAKIRTDVRVRIPLQRQGFSRPRQNSSVRRSPSCFTLDRRSLLAGAGAAFGMVALSPARVFADEETSESPFSKQLNVEFEKLLELDKFRMPHKTDDFLSIAKMNQEEFAKWYARKVQEPPPRDLSIGDRREYALELVGRKYLEWLASFSSSTDVASLIRKDKAREKLKGTNPSELNVLTRSYTEDAYPEEITDKTLDLSQCAADLIPEYAKVVRTNNASYGYVLNALVLANDKVRWILKTAKKAELVKYDEYRETSKKITEGSLALYDAVLRGVANFPDDNTLRDRVFDIFRSLEAYGDKQTLVNLQKGQVEHVEVAQAYDKLIEMLSKYYFSVMEERSSIDDVNRFVDYVVPSPNSSLLQTSCAPYVLYGVLSKNPKYFEVPVREVAETLETALSMPEKPGGFKRSHVEAQAAKLYRFFSRIRLASQSPHFLPYIVNRQGQRLAIEYITLFNRSHPPVPTEAERSVTEWVNEKLLMPLGGAYVPELERQTVKARIVPGPDRLIDDKNWRDLNESFMSGAGYGEDVKALLADVEKARLARVQDPYSREMSFRTLGELYSNNSGGEEYPNFSLLEDRFRFCTSPQEIRGIAYACYMAMGNSEEGRMQTHQFRTVVNSANLPNAGYDRRDKVREIAEKDISRSQALVIRALRILCRDHKFIISQIPGSDKRDVLAKPWYEVEKTGNKEEMEQYRKDTRHYFQINHNAYMFLAYLAFYVKGSTYGNRTFRKSITDLLEHGFRFHILEVDRMNPERTGEKIGALIEMWQESGGDKLVRENLAIVDALLYEGGKDFKGRDVRELFYDEILDSDPRFYNEFVDKSSKAAFRSIGHRGFAARKEHLEVISSYKHAHLDFVFGVF